MNIALCFCVRNCAKYLPSIFRNIELLKKLNFKIFCVFVYDNCSDNSEQILLKYKNNNDNIIIKNIINISLLRTERIAKARNVCLNIVYNELKDIRFHFMIDADDVCFGEWNIDIINKYLNRFDDEKWDCVSFNKHDYYDIWALLYDDFKNHCWGFGEKSSKITNSMKEDIIKKLKFCESEELNVYSAFNGFAIYKTERFKGFYYDGLYKNFKKLITDNERIKTIEAIKNIFNLDAKIYETYECCEHLFYHLTAFKEGRTIIISKYIII